MAVSPGNDTKQEQIDLVAQEVNWELKPGLKIPAWTFGGKVPGKEIHVKEEDWVNVSLTNRLPEPTSIHWHACLHTCKHAWANTKEK